MSKYNIVYINCYNEDDKIKQLHKRHLKTVQKNYGKLLILPPIPNTQPKLSIMIDTIFENIFKIMLKLTLFVS